MLKLAAVAFSTLLAVLLIGAPAPAAEKAEPQFVHTVFFTLKERTPQARAAFIESCRKYLTGHEGAVYFAVGTVAPEVEENVGVSDFDVALHVIFASKAAEGKYLVHPRHKQFVEENKGAWSKVRVFDTNVTPATP